MPRRGVLKPWSSSRAAARRASPPLSPKRPPDPLALFPSDRTLCPPYAWGGRRRTEHAPNRLGGEERMNRLRGEERMPRRARAMPAVSSADLSRPAGRPHHHRAQEHTLLPSVTAEIKNTSSSPRTRAQERGLPPSSGLPVILPRGISPADTGPPWSARTAATTGRPSRPGLPARPQSSRCVAGGRGGAGGVEGPGSEAGEEDLGEGAGGGPHVQGFARK